MTGKSGFLPDIIVSSSSIKVTRAWPPRVMIKRCRHADHCHNTGQWLACAASALADAACSCIIERCTATPPRQWRSAPTAKYYSFALSRDASACLSILYPTVAATAIQRETDATAADAREPARDQRASQIPKRFRVFPLTRRVSSGVRWIPSVSVGRRVRERSSY